MKPIYRLVLIIATAIVMSACGSTDDFVVRGQMAGVDVQTVTMTYFDRGGLQSYSVQSLGGKFSFRGTASKPTLAVISLGDGQRLATLVVKNGDEVTIEVDPANPYQAKVSGNAESREIASWLNANAESLESRNPAAVNAAVAKYVSGNKDKMSATAILVNYYNCEGYEAKADSLFSLLTVQARPSEIVQGFNSVVNAQLSSTGQAPVTYMALYELCDSLISFTPGRSSVSLLCFTTDDRTSLDSIRPRLRSLRLAQPKERLQMVEISTAPDSASWRRSFRADTVSNWYRTWVPGSMGAPAVRKLGIPRLPYFIVTDSTGAQLYRGPTLQGAEAALKTINPES